jgi:DNA-binding XRE family transcriptional regulator
MERSNNNVRHVREIKMLSKSELARRAGISPLTIDRIEKGDALPDLDSTKNLIRFGTRTFRETESVYGELDKRTFIVSRVFGAF